MDHNRNLVKALYDYKAAHNDEISFKRGDIITLTQMLEGGWWEGTCHEKTGWFPKDYVELIDEIENGDPAEESSVEKTRRQYKQKILDDIIESEKAHVGQLKAVQKSLLWPLSSANILSDEEFIVLCGNLDDLIDLHSNMLEELLRVQREQGEKQFIGALFMNYAKKFANEMKIYCENHPKAVIVLNNFREPLSNFCESHAASSATTRAEIKKGVLPLASALSKPFRRLEKYPSFLQEYERYLDDANPDRGNTQRAVSMFSEIIPNAPKYVAKRSFN